MTNKEIKIKIEEAFIDANVTYLQINKLMEEFLNGLNIGTIRSAEYIDENWIVNTWVKKGILLLYRVGQVIQFSDDSSGFFDKDTVKIKKINLLDNVRIVPGGSSIRNGAYIGRNVVCMPPMFINIGSYVDDGTMIDSHALVGTCAQIGKNVHISAAAQIGGVLEPIGVSPVIVEDNVIIGGNCGIYEGVIVRKGAILGSGVILNASTKIYDLVNETILQTTNTQTLQVPENAVVVPGTRGVTTEFGEKHKLSISTPLIVKYRDDKSNKKTELESFLR